MTDDNALISEEIRRLLAAPAGEDEASLAELEDTLTAGYAGALALGAECQRIERRIGEVAAELGRGENGGRMEELAELARRLSVAEDDLTRLRTLLASLRARASELRAGVSA